MIIAGKTGSERQKALKPAPVAQMQVLNRTLLIFIFSCHWTLWR